MIERYVDATNGNDSNPGSLASPWRTMGKVSTSIASDYDVIFRDNATHDWGNLSSQAISLRSDASAGQRIRLRSYEGETARLNGRLVIWGAGYDIQDLYLTRTTPAGDGTMGFQILGDEFYWGHCELTNFSTSIGFSVSTESEPTHRPSDWMIEHCHIHHCGEMPQTNYEHGIYIAQSTSGVLRRNLIHHNADRGIQFYPNGDGVDLYENIIVDNGMNVHFGGGGGETSDGIDVHNNVITHRKVSGRGNIESNGNSAATGNWARRNVVWMPDGSSAIDTSNGGFTVGTGADVNVTADPQYVNYDRQQLGIAQAQYAQADYRPQGSAARAALGAYADSIGPSWSSPAGVAMTALAGFAAVPLELGLRFVWSQIPDEQSVDQVRLRLWKQTGGTRPDDPTLIFGTGGAGTVDAGVHVGKRYGDATGLTAEPWQYEIRPAREE